LNYLCIPGVNIIYLWCVILLVCYWIWLVSILFRIFASKLISDIGLWFLFLVVSLSDFGIRVMLPHKMSLEVFHSFWKYEMSFVVSSFNIWQNSPEKLTYRELFFVGSSWLLIQVHLDLFKCSISSWFSLGMLYVSRNLFLVGYPHCWYKIAHVVSYNTFCFYGINCSVCFLIFDFFSCSAGDRTYYKITLSLNYTPKHCFVFYLFESSLSCSLNLPDSVSISIYFLKMQFFLSLTFFYCLSVVCSIYFPSDFFYLLSFANFGFVCSFSNSLEYNVRLFVIFLLF
jgi:hypothetical protein